MIELPCLSPEALVCDVFANSFQQRPGQPDALELDSDVAMVASIDYDLHQLPVVGTFAIPAMFISWENAVIGLNDHS